MLIAIHYCDQKILPLVHAYFQSLVQCWRVWAVLSKDEGFVILQRLAGRWGLQVCSATPHLQHLRAICSWWTSV